MSIKAPEKVKYMARHMECLIKNAKKAGQKISA